MISTKEMKELEDSCGISKVTLMGNAGMGIYKIINERFTELKGKRILIISHHGNNGGDGFVAARLLSEEAETDLLFIGDEARFKEEARINFKMIENNDRIQILIDPDQIDFDDYDIIIDAILGTGTQGELKEPIRSIIDLINDSKAYKIAVDIPTGLNPDTGEIIDKAVNADLVITFHDIKNGLEKLKDKTVIVDIGIKKD
jgi:NAD(P)H-hydrate epimerase